ncbi:TPA: hypothetical protein ACH3X1_009944 [Trebouxia sp. C0004]
MGDFLCCFFCYPKMHSACIIMHDTFRNIHTYEQVAAKSDMPDVSIEAARRSADSCNACFSDVGSMSLAMCIRVHTYEVLITADDRAALVPPQTARFDHSSCRFTAALCAAGGRNM